MPCLATARLVDQICPCGLESTVSEFAGVRVRISFTDSWFDVLERQQERKHLLSLLLR
jgi:hypothetical protein